MIIYNFNEKQIDIYEAGRLRLWARGRPFLINVDASHIE